VVFGAVQWLGAAYLAWLGLKMALARPGDAPVIQIHPGHYFRQAFTITLLNPKAIVFYMAFFPLFVDPARHQGLTTFAFMAVTIAVLTLLYSMTVVLLTRRFAQALRGNRVSRVGSIAWPAHCLWAFWGEARLVALTQRHRRMH
jgi:leucine efflux protein